MATQVQAKEDELLAEFRALISQVGEAVTKESVLPAIGQLINDWKAQTKCLETQFEKNMRTLNQASLAVANSLETHGRQLRNDMSADSRKWEAALEQQAALLAKGLAAANSEVSAFSRSLEQLANELAGAWEAAATSFEGSCDRILASTDVPAQLAALNGYTEESRVAIGHLCQATDSAAETVQRWQAEVSGVLRAVESRLPPLTEEIGTLNAGLRNWQLLADEAKKSNTETAQAVGGFAVLARRHVELTEAMAKTLSKQLLGLQDRLDTSAADVLAMFQRAQQERSVSEEAVRESIKELQHRLGKQVQEQSESLHAVVSSETASSRSALQTLMETHDRRLEEARASTTELMESVKRELRQATSETLGWLTVLIVATGGALVWLHLR
jgi:uncharacterized phage infection (PIP) family protein YhgE